MSVGRSLGGEEEERPSLSAQDSGSGGSPGALGTVLLEPDSSRGWLKIQTPRPLS